MDSYSTTFTPDKLIAGDNQKLITETVYDLTAPGADVTYVRGTVIALNTVSGKLVPYVLGGADGAGAFYGVLAEEQIFVTADADRNVVDYIAGQFNQDALVFTGAGAISDIKVDARDKSCFLVVVSNNDVL